MLMLTMIFTIVATKQQAIQTCWGGQECERTDSRGWQRPSGPTQLHSCCSRAWFWDRTLDFGDKCWNSEHTVLKKPIQPDEPKVPDDSWRSWRRHTQCERSCLSPQQHGRTRIIQVPLPNYLSDKKCKCIRDSVKCNSRCHKNRICQNQRPDQIKLIKETLFLSIECHLLLVLKS